MEDNQSTANAPQVPTSTTAAPDPAPTETQARELTFGEKAVGIGFNPSNDPKVQEIKEKAAAFIDTCRELNDQTPLPAEVSRMIGVAITEAQTAQMWAVKAATWKE